MPAGQGGDTGGGEQRERRWEDGLGRVDVCHTANAQELKDVINDQTTHTHIEAQTRNKHLSSLFLLFDLTLFSPSLVKGAASD